MYINTKSLRNLGFSLAQIKDLVSSQDEPVYEARVRIKRKIGK